MKRIFCIFVFLIILLSYSNVFVLSEDTDNNDILTFKEAMVTKIEVYDSLLLYERGTVVPLCYINESKSNLDISNYYNLQENIDRYSSVITGGGSLIDIEYYPDIDYYSRSKLDDFFTICYKEYNNSKMKLIKKGYGNEKDITMNDIILDVRAYVDFTNNEYKELTYKEYEELKSSNKNNSYFCIRSINFVLDNKEIGKRNEIIYDGVFLYHNYYLNEKETIKWEVGSHLDNIHFNRGELRVSIFSIFSLLNFEPIGTNYSDKATKDLLLNSFKRYYSEIEGYPVDGCKFEEKELMTAHLIFLNNTEYTDTKYPDKRDLINKLKNSNLSTDFPGRVHIFNDPLLDSRINIVFDNNTPYILQIDSDLPEYPRYFLDTENKLLWGNPIAGKSDGVRNLVLIKYLNRRIEEIEYVTNDEMENIEYYKQLNFSNLDELTSKYDSVSSLNSFLRLSKIYNKQLYENIDYYHSSKEYIYNTNLDKIDDLILNTEVLKNKFEREIDKRDKIEEQIYTRISISLAITFGLVGILSLVFNYLENGVISIIKIWPLTIETKKKSMKGIVVLVIIAPIIFFLCLVILRYLL